MFRPMYSKELKIREIKCQYIGCKNCQRLNSDVKYYKFPRAWKHTKVWQLRCGSSGVENKTCRELINGNYFVCSDHFSEKMFVDPIKKFLVRGAMPNHFLHKTEETEETNFNETIDLEENINIVDWKTSAQSESVNLLVGLSRISSFSQELFLDADFGSLKEKFEPDYSHCGKNRTGVNVARTTTADSLNAAEIPVIMKNEPNNSGEDDDCIEVDDNNCFTNAANFEAKEETGS